MGRLNSVLRHSLRFIVLAAAYFALAKVGLVVAFAHGTISPVWPASGLAIAALALWGPGHWPAIALGAFIANFTIPEPPGVACGIAAGNVAEALLGAMALRRFGPLGELRRVSDAVVVLAVAGLAPLPSASIGPLSLTLGGLSDWDQYPVEWLVWWVGDSMGALLVVPLLLAWAGERGPDVPPLNWAELIAILAVTSLATNFAYLNHLALIGLALTSLPMNLFILPPLVWAALRMPPRGSTLALAAMGGWAIGHTVSGHGPMADEGLIASLTWLQLMLAGLCGTSLVLIAAIAERTGTSASLLAAKRGMEEEKRRADAANLAKSRFVAAIRHDIRQPLQAVQLFMAVLEGQPLTDKGRDVVKRTNASLHSIAAALDALKDITAMEIDFVQPTVSVFPANDLLAQLAAESQLQAEKVGLQFHYVPCSLALETDQQLLGRLLRNLLSNAFRYTRSGRVLLGCRRRGRVVAIVVCDTGPGIPESEHEAIFQAYHRLLDPAPRPSAEGEGLGLGLATVRRLASILSLSVSVRSNLGKGSVFSVEVPVARG